MNSQRELVIEIHLNSPKVLKDMGSFTFSCNQRSHTSNMVTRMKPMHITHNINKNITIKTKENSYFTKLVQPRNKFNYHIQNEHICNAAFSEGIRKWSALPGARVSRRARGL